MEPDIHSEFERLKKDFLAAERTFQQEKDCLLKVVNAFGIIVDTQAEFQDNYRSIKALVFQKDALSVVKIEQAVDAIKRDIFAMETRDGVTAGVDVDEKVQALTERLRETCLTIKRIAATLLEDFYPVTQEMKVTAEAIQFDCKEPIEPAAFNRSAADFMAYINTLKRKIAGDFSYINSTFIGLLGQVKELEKALQTEIADDSHLQEIERFEQDVHREMGSIMESFSIEQTVEQIKNAVFNRLSNIKQMLASRKTEEAKKIRRAKKNILKLRKRISQAEKDAQRLSRQAKKFKSAALTDGLTGLFNRKAFDDKLEKTLGVFNAGGDPFLLLLFDLNKFKWINDTFGHVAGDKVLQLVARTLQETFRKGDFIARYGGDEFAVIFEQPSEASAVQRIATFHEKFSKKRFASHKSGDIQVGLSAGFARVEAGDTADDLIHKADTSMYDMKKSGPSASGTEATGASTP